MDKQELKDAIKEALRELYFELEARKEEEKRAKREAKIKEHGPVIPKRARQILDILREHESLSESEWRQIIRERMLLSVNATRSLWHRYATRMVAEGWVKQRPDGNYFCDKTD